jgi:transcriptional regulator with XRE-family HTH domain
MITFGENVLLWRLYRSLSQERLAGLSNIPRPNLSDIEKGKRDVTLSTIRSLADALGVRPGTLVDGVPPEHKKHARDLPRDFMEKVADAVARGNPPRGREELQLFRLLHDILANSLKCTGKQQEPPAPPTRKSATAWLRLRSLYPNETIKSLISRTREHAGRI